MFAIFDKFGGLGGRSIPGVKNAEYIGSPFTIRIILPDVEKIDSRPTMVGHSSDMISIFGGKLATSIDISQDVMNIVN